MRIEHLGEKPQIDPSAYIAPTATLCGAVKIGANTRIMFGATVIAEGGTIEIGADCVVLENAVLRSTARHSLRIGDRVLIGPNAHVVGCTLEDNVFIATGAAVFHGARLGAGSEVRIHGVVHLRTELPADATVPIGWVAVGDPAVLLPPGEHDRIWAVQEPLNFPKFVYGVDRRPDGGTIMPEIMTGMARALGAHQTDRVLEEAESEPAGRVSEN
ncbi:carbonic anhydrase/acetyltransferase-like protein (isoleucine patch superfamily) [Hydrogenispora ethanolica]|jgi:carbonic anhydrase/acetyltransferase-like protein (isoleucine patch superfamily)|uniref:Carbonic anhydrase/acetyltransferase-like protein (Isoleucine patch superfamily) n=1 Tax=Hydrogenispora ethanolica TaxID=1082276 RepID=A0A4R1S735_HYDET|nr:gamma carbonic anhydrase family protein [Hydrogenispora ethanolica]TCL74282.1 carbonic anhydrase/acetyltransferase-like protein (isoleucine patch superfamily) [Hydrogenispora ethanolica]